MRPITVAEAMNTGFEEENKVEVCDVQVAEGAKG